MRRRWAEAREALHEAAALLSPPPAGRVPLREAMGRALAEGTTAPAPVPHFSSSAMDGYAVAGPPPWTLLEAPVEDSEGRNVHRRALPLRPGGARPVLTGSLLPPGADGVVRSEHALLEGGLLRPLPEHPHRTGRDIRRAGEELAPGALLLEAGTRLGPRQLALLASCGIDEVTVREPVGVSLGRTGNEVIPAGLPGPGEVRDAFSPGFPTLLRAWGARVDRNDWLPDDAGAVRRWIAGAEGRLVVLTGGSGSSGQDFVRSALADLGADLVASSLAVRPGHPTILGILPGERIVLGLPGNPLAAHTSLYSFAPAACAGLLGSPLPSTSRGRLGAAVAPLPSGEDRLLPARWDGERVLPLSGTRSHMLSGLAAAEVLCRVGPEGGVEGQEVELLRLD
ncbi:molybdopterin molybdotransferase MoeA [Rothia halotolerans]|uniref:molybdopterin molybdotransferase MoeA n=1 Tax=Rothia halotolerans TaxID=405770 RepID=UPI0013E9E361|nr:molybdopterin molybdotransferase MoeA [Rothia halotolerans]